VSLVRVDARPSFKPRRCRRKLLTTVWDNTAFVRGRMEVT
jgi:hypothetical protein